MSTHQESGRRWWRWDLEAFIWLLFQLIGVPLTMLEFSGLERHWIVVSLFVLWLPTVAFLILDFIGGAVSRTSVVLFIVWACVVLSYAVYTNVAV